ncbi:OmpW family protein [Rhizobium sp. L1K21]|uniref:OmpW/AlkL family protein n=1 Tax=Rhizobium sp. L1K21 TaxID=2954933 RepID=UPI002092310D|nr:OmpW family protein [Rhizobium sp. L1K21]MCO6186436.1 OmpW family protein [Rhizobium sp. L1K21]
MNTIWTTARTLALSASALALATAVNAADMTPFSTPAEEAAAISLSPWMVRVRGLGVITRDSGNVDGVAGSNLSYSDSVIPELDISYFFNENFAAELILGTTFAKVNGSGTIAGLGKLGQTWLLPPTLTLQYHFTNFGNFKPYVGAGINYSIFYNQKASSANYLHIDNTFGAALQVGFDYMVDNHWGINFDVKKIFLRAKYQANVTGVGNVTGTAKLDPWLIGGGITYRF